MSKKKAINPDLQGDALNAQFFAKDNAGKSAYVPQRGQWIMFDGVVWRPDELRCVYQMGLETTKNMLIEAAQINLQAARASTDAERRELTDKSMRIVQQARGAQNKGKLEAMLALAATLPGIVLSQAELDADDMKFACKNGVIDLEEGAFREARVGDYCTRQGGAAYSRGWEDEACPVWEKFLSEVQPDPDARVWLQRFFGYCLTGRTSEQIMLVMHGGGANGKSVAIETLKKVMGSYSLTAQFETFTERKNEGVRNDLARLDKARLVVAQEGADGARLDEGIIKQMTGDDDITARFLHREFFTFRPRFKVVLVSNHKPVITGTDNGIWRRVVLMPWSVTIPAERRDRDLARKLEAELPGILAWCLKGLADYLEVGLHPLPASISRATENYRRDSDTIGVWLDDCCEIGEQHITPSGELYENYTRWAQNNGHRPVSSKTLGDRLRERGMTPTRDRAGKRAWAGLAVR